MVTPHKESARLLIIDGSSPLREELRGYFTNHGFAVDTAITEDDAVWLIGKHRYDAVLIDLPSAVQNGFFILEVLYISNDQVTVVTMGEHQYLREDGNGLERLIKFHLLKPFQLSDALGVVNGALLAKKVSS